MFNLRGSRRTLQYAVACFLIAAAAFTAPRQAAAGQSASLAAMTPAARDEANKGIDAFKNGHFEEAVEHFQRAVELDPDSTLARSYLGFALSQNVIPGLNTPENLKTAQEAIDAYTQVLVGAPHNANAMRQIAGIYFSIGKLEDAKAWQKKVLSEDAQDADAAYTIGVIDWIEARRNVMAAMTPAGIFDDGQGNVHAPAEVMAAINAKNAPLVEEGVKYLDNALQQQPYYEDAMEYLNLTYRLKANLDRDNEQARQKDLSTADAWRQKAVETRKLIAAHEVNDPRLGAGRGNRTFDQMALSPPLAPPRPPPPPPPPPPQFFAGGAQATPPKRINISAGVAVGLLIEKTNPVIYPPIAKAARITGTVVLQATISKTGEVENLSVVSGPAMLQQAALDAVKTWRYKPYLLNGLPVEVETTVNLIFSLGK
jgi:TonB family protein